MGKPKKYNTDEERKTARRETTKRYRERHKDDIAAYRAAHKEEMKAYNAVYYQKNRDDVIAKRAEYYATPFGRASLLVRNYCFEDKKYNRGECTIDAQWIVDNIFTQPCRYCGETDWLKLGCDRKDSSLPHTPDNCVPCCLDCNKKKYTIPYEKYLEQIDKSDTD